jgi:hypothetical protein
MLRGRYLFRKSPLMCDAAGCYHMAEATIVGCGPPYKSGMLPPYTPVRLCPWHRMVLQKVFDKAHGK